MAEQGNSSSTFVRAFIPGLVLGFVPGVLLGALLSAIIPGSSGPVVSGAPNGGRSTIVDRDARPTEGRREGDERGATPDAPAPDAAAPTTEGTPPAPAPAAAPGTTPTTAPATPDKKPVEPPPAPAQPK